MVLSIVTRGARFGMYALLLSRYGEAIKGLLDRHLALIAALFVVGLVGGFVAFKYLF